MAYRRLDCTWSIKRQLCLAHELHELLFGHLGLLVGHIALVSKDRICNTLQIGINIVGTLGFALVNAASGGLADAIASLTKKLTSSGDKP